MANGYYKSLYDDLFKGSSKLGTSTPKTDIEKVQNSIDNATTKLNAAGVEAPSEDNRNFIEKGLNLTPDQNWVFDIFEILGRPQQALFGGLDSVQKGEDFFEGMEKGWTGDKYTYGGDLLRNAGVEESGEGEGFFGSDIGVDDVGGFILDILADPADLALIPVTGGANLAVGASADAARTGAKVAGTAADAAKVAGTAADAAKAAKTGIKFKSASDLLFEGAGKAIKGGAKLTDTGIESVLKKMDAAGVKGADGTVTKLTYDNPFATSAANLGKKTVDGSATNVIGKLETYKDMKDTINRAFKYASNVPKKIADSVRKNDSNSVKASIELKPLYDKIDNSLNNYASSVAKTMGDESAEAVADIAKQADLDIANLKEYMNYNRKTTGEGLLSEAMDGTLTHKIAGDEGVSLLNSIADDVNMADRGYKLTVDIDDNGVIKLNQDWDDVIKDRKIEFDPEKLGSEITKGTNYTDADLEEFGKLMKKYETDDAFKKLYADTDNIFNEANSVLDKYYGTKLATNYADNTGYMRHAFNRQQFDNYNNLGFVSEYGQAGVKGNAKVLADRKFDMSAREANNMFRESISKNLDTLDGAKKAKAEKILSGDGIFKEGLTASFDSYLENVPKLAKESQLIDEVLVKATFGDYKELKTLDSQIAKAVDKGDEVLEASLQAKKIELLNNSNMKILTNKDNIVPRGYKQLNSDEVRKMANKMKKMSSELGIKDMDEMAKYLTTNGGKMAVNNEVLRLLDIGTDTKQVKGFSRLYDKYLNFFKRNKVLSPTFQMNNIVGNTSNMYLSGISATKQATLFPKAIDVMNKGENVMLKAAQGLPLSKADQEIFDIWNGFIDAGFGNPKSMTAMNLADMPESLQKYFDGTKKFTGPKDLLVDGLPYINNKMNNYIDTSSRLVVFMEAMNNPKYLSNLGVEDAGQAVRKVLFDPSEMTSFEKDVMKKIMPFYTFTKKNLAFQIENLSKNGSQYHKMLKAQDRAMEAATGGNEENVQDWMRNNLYIPIPTLGEDGSYTVMRTTIPFGSVIDTVTDPLGLTNMVGPLPKLPFELATNTNFFSGDTLEEFPGEMSTNIPFLSKSGEQILGATTGLDVPLKNLFKFGSGIEDTMNQGGDVFEGMGQGFKNMTTINGNIESDKLGKMYDELEQLETLMEQYKQQGYEFSTINELEKANKNTKVQDVMAQLNRYNGIKSNPYMAK